eukprot:c13597_g1_i1.p2 GENE.c13597_g1_i1~~c13597_g1_i1.p2  ORF type:complete len:126 (+),score=14.19 c13597_g1_i1:115-492(+)
MFGRVHGVVGTRVGYTGGQTPNPTYKTVCGGDGHTEAIRVTFDPSSISYQELLNIWSENHSMASRSRPQYKSAIWYDGPEQEQEARAFVDRLRSQQLVLTDVQPFTGWTDAEEYHQRYLSKMLRN